MRKSFIRLIKIVIQQIAAYDPNFQHALRLHRMCKIMIGLTIFWALITVITTAGNVFSKMKKNFIFLKKLLLI